MIVLRGRHLCLMGLFFCFVAVLAAVLWRGSAAYTSAFADAAFGEGPTVVVDAGHGGEDGGAVAADGTVESGLNLAIDSEIARLTFAGVDTVMTRTEDAAIYDESASRCGRRRCRT